MHDQIDGFTIILNMEPIPNVQSISIEGKGLIINRIGDKQGNQLFWKLIGPIIVGGTSNDHREIISSPVGEGYEIGTGLACCIRVVRSQGRGLCKTAGGTEGTINLISRDLNKTVQPMAATCLE